MSSDVTVDSDDQNTTSQSNAPKCGAKDGDQLAEIYFYASFVVFFLIPCLILLVLYALISKHLIREPTRVVQQHSAATAAEPADRDESRRETHTPSTVDRTAGSVEPASGVSGNIQRQTRRLHRARHQNSNRARRYAQSQNSINSMNQ